MSEVVCPECRKDDFKAAQGLHGHLRFEHQYSAQEASEVLENQRNEPEEPPDDRGNEEAQREFGDVSRRVSARLSEAADAAAARKMLDSLEGGQAAGRSPFEEAMAEVAAEALKDSLRADREALSAEDVREVVRSEVRERPMADGGHMTDRALLAAALEHDAEPDAVRELADALDGSSPLTDLIDALGRWEAEQFGSMMSSLVEGFITTRAAMTAPVREVQPEADQDAAEGGRQPRRAEEGERRSVERRAEPDESPNKRARERADTDDDAEREEVQNEAE